MNEKLAICLEDLRPAHEGVRYQRCCVLYGLAPGLALDARGQVAWKTDAPAACRLFVSLDRQLICLKEPGSPGDVTVWRRGRSTRAPEGKPVVLLDGDELVVGEVRLRVHVHGWTGQAFAPSFLAPPASGAGSRSRVAAAGLAAALGLTAMTGCWSTSDPKKPVEVRDQPPAPPQHVDDVPGDQPPTDAGEPDSPDGDWE
jgi:hypothetical protein